MRKLPHFVNSFREYMADKGSPPLYTKWTGIFTISAVLERKVWITTNKGTLFPNQYIILVGPAGIGKSVCTSTAFNLINDVRDPQRVLYIAPTSVTKASLIDALHTSERTVTRLGHNPPFIKFNSLIIIPNELGVFLPAWEGDFMNTMTDLWDNNRYAETRRSRAINIEIPAPQLNMLSATTPHYLNALLPEGAWESGFMSRTLLAYSGEVIHGDIFGGDAVFTAESSLYKDLLHDLSQIYNLFGELHITDAAKEAINSWARSGGAPVPDHPKLASYVTRRLAHALKLATVSAASSSNDLVLDVENWREALDWLTELERFIPDIFKSMKVGGDARAMEELYHFIYHEFIRNKDPVQEHLVHAFLADRVPVHSIEPIIKAMERGRLVEKKMTKAGTNGYEPRAKRPM